MNKIVILNSKLTILLVLGVIIPATIIIFMKKSYEYKKEQLEKLHNDLNIVSFVQEVSSELFSIEYALKFVKNYDELPAIFVISTVNNSVITKLADLNRFSNTLRLVPKLTWLIVEDSDEKTKKMKNFLETLDMPNIVHLSAKSVNENPSISNYIHGASQRNYALQWIRENYASKSIDQFGVVYFAQPEHSYDIRIFEEMRLTKTVSVWPIALVKDTIYQAPVCSNNKVVDWYCGDACPDIDFPINLNGFAVNLDLIVDTKSAFFAHDSSYQVNDFIKSLIKAQDQLEPKADMCSKIYVWNTITLPPHLPYAGQEKQYNINYEEFMLEQI